MMTALHSAQCLGFAVGVLVGIGSSVGAGHATDPSLALGLPLDCTIGQTCWVVNYVDVDPGQEAKDFTCGPRTYGEHEGVDFAIRDLAVMRHGMPVLASAPGVVTRVRDGVEDRSGADLDRPPAQEVLRGRDCGNGVLIEHGHGWTTQYCHLRRNTLRVRSGQDVKQGAILGFVGLSGKTAFPHVHLTVRHEGLVVDPFTGLPAINGCGQQGRALWADGVGIRYEPVALYHAGFSEAPPDILEVREGRISGEAISAGAGALILWVDMFGVVAGDEVRLEIHDAGGLPILNRAESVSKTQARRFVYAGVKRPADGWNPGLYTGRIVLRRMEVGQPKEWVITRNARIAPVS